MRKKILGLFHLHENGVLASVTESWCRRLQTAGFETETLDLKAPDAGQRLNGILQGDIAFCFGLQGVGSRLEMQNKENLWTHYRTPFLGLHHDSPSCNIYNHFSDSPFVANLYFFDCLFDIQKRYVKNPQINKKIPFKSSFYYRTEPYVPFPDRPIRLFFLKSGKSPAIYAANINQIKPPLRDAVWAAIEKAWRNENLVICDLLNEAFTSCNLNAAEHWAEFWGIADWIENYIRTKRAADFADWLKYQEGALIVGDGWDFIDKTGSKAVFKPGISADEAFKLYGQSKFVCNTSPYGRDMIHERVYTGLDLGCHVLTDTNAWWDENFSDVPPLCRFRWGDDFAAHLTQTINDPAAAEKIQSGLGHDRIWKKLSGIEDIGQIIDAATEVREFAGRQSTPQSA